MVIVDTKCQFSMGRGVFGAMDWAGIKDMASL